MAKKVVELALRYRPGPVQIRGAYCGDPSDIYNLSTLLGESLVLQDPKTEMRVVYLRNMVGSGQLCSTFIGALLAEAKATKSVTV
jgi:hypothetical protein